jgi:hypothetical protein
LAQGGEKRVFFVYVSMYLQFSMQVTDLLFENVIFNRFSSSTQTNDTLCEYSMVHWKKSLARLNILLEKEEIQKYIDSSADCHSCALFTTVTWLCLRISKMPAKNKKRKPQLINAGIRISGGKKVKDDEEDAVIHDDEDDWHEGMIIMLTVIITWIAMMMEIQLMYPT